VDPTFELGSRCDRFAQCVDAGLGVVGRPQEFSNALDGFHVDQQGDQELRLGTEEERPVVDRVDRASVRARPGAPDGPGRSMNRIMIGPLCRPPADTMGA